MGELRKKIKKEKGMLCAIRRRALLDVAAGLEVLHVVDATAHLLNIVT